MPFSIWHETQYRYSAPVALEPHVLRLTPRTESALLHWHRLTADPSPSVRRDAVDRYGNRVTQLKFEGLTSYLRIVSCFELETRAAASPVRPALPSLPWPSGISGPLADYLPAGRHDESVRDSLPRWHPKADTTHLPSLSA